MTRVGDGCGALGDSMNCDVPHQVVSVILYYGVLEANQDDSTIARLVPVLGRVKKRIQ